METINTTIKICLHSYVSYLCKFDMHKHASATTKKILDYSTWLNENWISLD